MEQGKKKAVNRVKKDISSPASFTPPEELREQLLNTMKEIYGEEDIAAVKKAYNLAYKAHDGQKRKSGEPYIIHPICVAIILAELELDKETIMAGLLHDVVEDTEVTYEDVVNQFGEEVAALVDGVTKLGQLSYSKDKIEVQAENLRKMFLAMAKDIRVILIKLADRLHNMRTMQFMRPEKQKEKSRETMDIYAPIAHRLGISKIKVELDDLSLRYLKPDVYEELERSLDSRKEERETFIREIVEEVGGHIKRAGIKAEIDGRVKHFFSIYKKMVNQKKTIDQIYDLFAVRIKVDTVKDCYAALGIIHEMYKPIPGRFKDYIAMPKQNMYQSLHTTLIGPEGHPFEIQIRTFEMHRVAEYGIAAHWKYKENKNTPGLNKEEEKLSWLREVLEWQRDMDDNKEFLSLLKTNLDLFAEQVYCFTPNGDVKNLANGSTPIDFAYSIHSAVGNKMVGARVNGKQVPFEYKLQNGDRVEIITSQNSKGPSRDWLSLVKTAQARSKINQWFKHQFKEENIIKGKELLAQYCKSKSINLQKLMKPEYIKKVELKYGFKDWDSVCAAVGHGGLKEGQVINKMLSEDRKRQKKEITDEQILSKTQQAAPSAEKEKTAKSKGGIVVQGANDVSVRFSKCCNPVPGDEIVGFITRGRGVSIHRTDCANLLNMPEHDRARLIEAEWQVREEDTDQTYTTEINIYANNRKGLLADVSRIFLELDIDIISINVSNNKKGRATLSMSFDITGVSQLNRIISKIRGVEGVIDIERTAG
ncbi:MAG TPA: bifunctional (p)ppGpp synthetase/guanosine-3',5'-bis(diphosphate) 3'-pyrophosphohydrolase [Candidatus Anaerostipes excrementavium]|uniref:GTP diphosphokinase n=1 Tax=Candidatus Anaerostipes excrementavium TaxID=2838463 RepID=A0A9D1WUE0_9FIRM|nr:bifunctional (p)ppGpp synthetase/guanosine-3',5'-bis(diphosphate) 3'-pyrophosphohydrolase [uncultured Anaerostipes sp.]HIX67281.1 bifunctional (p)ppGpp synthetase/guanosine-3',5'-bis(diphosphate) 3'-pyrophosphohydrolase [Candidatus Anaerostipes excrementavium]